MSTSGARGEHGGVRGSLVGTPIDGLLELHLPVHEDERGWFKENWHRAAMVELGLPDFDPVQHNLSFNNRRGATRGFHAEPWDKLVSVATGRVLGAWVDLRPGPAFGTVHQVELDPSVAVFVPAGVANAYQALVDGTCYSYLVNAHWQPGTDYPGLDLGDPTVGIDWPIALTEAEVSAKDRANPRLDAVTPLPGRRILILGAGGQAGQALQTEFPHAHAVDRGELDLADVAAMTAWPWADYDVVLNAAGYTAVDAAESGTGLAATWATNAVAPALLALLARQHRFTLVHYSSDYVFDGSRDEHPEDEPPSPLGAYAASKAAGDLAVATAPRHYLLRTSWLVGDGPNFVRTMQRLAAEGACPTVVDDQHGRLTFSAELARATRHLIDAAAPHGTYNVTNAGPVMSWADIARAVFELCGRPPGDVRPVTTQQYAATRQLAVRPAHSTLALDRLRATGFEPEDARDALRRWLTEAQRP